MEHSHLHGHRPPGGNQTEGKLWISIALNLTITIAELVGGLLSGSLALFSDALHNLNDTSSLGISLAARKISKRKANVYNTFGYNRAEIIGPFIHRSYHRGLACIELPALYGGYHSDPCHCGLHPLAKLLYAQGNH